MTPIEKQTWEQRLSAEEGILSWYDGMIADSKKHIALYRELLEGAPMDEDTTDWLRILKNMETHLAENEQGRQERLEIVEQLRARYKQATSTQA